MKNKRDCILTPCVIALGIVLGGFAKAGDVVVQGSILGNTLHAFGTVSTGIFIWIAVCTAISVLSKTRIWAGVNVLLFLAAMIFSYYLYSYFIVDYFVWSVVKFWLIMLVPSMIAGFIVWGIKTSRVLKYAVIALGTVIMIFDMIVLQGAIAIAAIMDVILYAVFLIFILSKRVHKT